MDFDNANKDGYMRLSFRVIVCANPGCREYSVQAWLQQWVSTGTVGGRTLKSTSLSSWMLRPQSTARPFPDYIPKAILSDYEEACSIVSLSPKASATLSRRCLQGMIRDFWKISKTRLFDEIAELENKIAPQTWAAIDAVRKIGNIGAHMERDIDVIVDVDPEEAALLSNLIEMLLEEWYVRRFEREQKLQQIVATAGLKKSQQNP